MKRILIIDNGAIVGVAQMVVANPDMPKSDDEIDQFGRLQLFVPEQFSNCSDFELIEEFRYIDGELTHVGKCPDKFHVFDTNLKSWLLDLNLIKREASDVINSSCANSIISGYKSKALGSIHNYPSTVIDQQNLNNAVVASLIDGSILTYFWCADETGLWSLVAHTGEQIKQVAVDMKNHIGECQLKNATLQAQIEAASAREEIEAIVW